MKPSISLSIIITTYNRADRLIQAIKSVYTQLGTHDEIIIVDDGSTDHTRSLLTYWLKKSSVKYFRHKCNLGVQHARNSGIKLATKSWISFLDSDDQYLPGAITIIKKAIHKYGQNYPVLQFMLKSSKLRDTGPQLGYLPGKPWRTYSPNLSDIVLKKDVVGDMHRVINTKLAQKYLWQKANPGQETYHYAHITSHSHRSLYLNQVVVLVDETDPASHSKNRHRLWPGEHINLYQDLLKRYQAIFNTDRIKRASYQKLISNCFYYQHDYLQSLQWLLKAVSTYPPIIFMRAI